MAPSNWIELGQKQWLPLVLNALGRDDAEALKLLAKDRRFSIWDIHTDVNVEGGATVEHVPLTVAASYAGAFECLGALAELAGTEGHFSPVNGAMKSLSERYEKEAADRGPLARMLTAVMEGVARGIESGHAGFYLWMEPQCPNAMRHIMTCIANKPCNTPSATSFDREHLVNKRKVLADIARGDRGALKRDLQSLVSHVRMSGAETVFGDNAACRTDALFITDIKLFLESSLCLGDYEFLGDLFAMLRGHIHMESAPGELLACLLATIDLMGHSGDVVLETGLGEIVERCVALEVLHHADAELGEAMMEDLAPAFPFVNGAFKNGVMHALAIMEKRQLASHTVGGELIDRASEAMRI